MGIHYMLYILFIVFVTNGLELPTCVTPPGFVRVTAKFLVSSGSFAVDNARNTCEKYGLKQGNIRNRDEEKDIEEYIFYQNNQEALFIGGFKEAGTNKKFLDSYGRSLSYAHFYESEPSYDEGEMGCEFLYMTPPPASNSYWPHLNRTHKALWNDGGCDWSLQLKVLCEFHENTCNLPTQENKQKLHAIEHTKYYYSEMQRNWADSNEDCENLGKLPVSLRSENELDSIRLALLNTPVSYYFVWIGGKSENYEKSKDIIWKEIGVNTSISLNNTGNGYISPKCTNVAVGNYEKIYSQLSDCSHPMFFLCREKDEDPITTPTTPTCSTTINILLLPPSGKTMEPTTAITTTTTTKKPSTITTTMGPTTAIQTLKPTTESSLASYVALNIYGYKPSSIMVWAYYGIIGYL